MQHLFIPLAPIWLLTFYWSIDAIVNKKSKKAVPIIISAIVFLFFVLSVVLASSY